MRDIGKNKIEGKCFQAEVREDVYGHEASQKYQNHLKKVM